MFSTSRAEKGYLDTGERLVTQIMDLVFEMVANSLQLADNLGLLVLVLQDRTIIFNFI